jgi:AraC-like DNA-binding protein
MKWSVIILLILSCFGKSTSCTGQTNEIDTLTLKSYQYLKDGFKENIKDPTSATIYADAYILKAKNSGDSLQMANGYYRKLILDQDKHHYVALYDTIISLTRGLKKQNFPTIAFFDKGVYYYNKRKFKDALENYLLAIKFNQGSNKDHLNFLLNNSIALLKSRIDENYEALNLFKKCWEHVNQGEYRKTQSRTYLNVLFSLADSFRKNKVLDSAYFYNQKGIQEALLLKDEQYYYQFVLNDGIISYYEGNLSKALDSLEKGLNNVIKIDDKPNTAVGYYYKGRILLSSNNELEAINCFKKVDTVFLSNRDILPETRDNYKFLTDYYRREKDLSNELIYIERRIEVDSILFSNYKFLSKNIIDKYDTPILIKEKEAIIAKLNNKNSTFKIVMRILSGFIFLMFLFGIYQYRRKIVFKKRFEELIKDGVENNKKQLKSNKIQKKELDISEDIINEILDALNKFEASESFRDEQLNISKLSNQLSTNTNYLTRVISHYKNKTVLNYLKDLRVKYAFERLKDDSIFRKYTIKAIAQESGFKGAESFSKEFFKKYGVNPSYFIKELNILNN